MVRVIRGINVDDNLAAAPRSVAPFKRAAEVKYHCMACAQYFHKLHDIKYAGKNAKFTGLYALRDVDHLPYRIYFCEVCGSGSACKVQFYRCRYKDVIVEQDMEDNNCHYVSCLEPSFKCDHSRRDVPIHHWFCLDLDGSPTIPWEDIYSSEWFSSLGREIIPEQIVMDPEALRKWIDKKVMPKF